MNKALLRKFKAGSIIGVLLHDDSVESQFVPLGSACLMCHGDLWPNRFFFRWRWTVEEQFNKSVYDTMVDVSEEQWCYVINHMAREYSLPFDGDGFFNYKEFYNETNEEY